jgi:hypothetical protein
MIKKLILLVVFSLLSFSALAQEEEGTWFSYGDLHMTLEPSLPQNVNITRYAGDPYDLQYPGGPQPERIELVFYNLPPAPEAAWASDMVIWLYRVEDLAGYPMHLTEYENLQTMLTEKPELPSALAPSAYMPDLPVATATQVIRSHAAYRETCTYKGVSYLSYYAQDVSPFVPSFFFYKFQAISVDGQYYVSASFRLDTTLFPSELPSDFDYDAFAANYETYLTESLATIDAASADDFAPSLTTLDSFIENINFGGAITECF